jgi:hypothetical protein
LKETTKLNTLKVQFLSFFDSFSISSHLFESLCVCCICFDGYKVLAILFLKIYRFQFLKGLKCWLFVWWFVSISTNSKPVFMWLLAFHLSSVFETLQMIIKGFFFFFYNLRIKTNHTRSAFFLNWTRKSPTLLHVFIFYFLTIRLNSF